MNKSVIFAFGAGAAVGAAVAWFFTKTKYEQLMDVENEAAHDYWRHYYASGDAENTDDTKPVAEKALDLVEEMVKPAVLGVAKFQTAKPDLMELAASITEEEYISPDVELEKPTYNKIDSLIKDSDPEEEDDGWIEEEDDSMDEYDLTDSQVPYVIEPEEYDTLGYETSALSYYADGIVADEWGDVVEEDDWDETFGKESLEHFDENGVVHVRNDVIAVDYEITRDMRNYEDAINCMEE